MQNVFAKLGFIALATVAASAASGTYSSTAHAGWVASDTAWTGCAQPGGQAPTLGVANDWAAITVGCDSPDRDGNYALRQSTRLNPTSGAMAWASLPGAATTVAMAPDSGKMWAVNAEGSIYWYDATGGAWRDFPGCARSIGAGDKGVLWSIGCTANGAGGNTIQVWSGTSWRAVPGAAAQIAVSPEGTPWVLTVQGSIYQWNGAAFAQLPGCARSLSVGAESTVSIIGCEDAPAGGHVYSWSGFSWGMWGSQMGKKIGVTRTGTPFVADAYGKLYTFKNEKVSASPSGGKLVVKGAGWADPTVAIQVRFDDGSPTVYATATTRIDGVFQSGQFTFGCNATTHLTGLVLVSGTEGYVGARFACK